MACRDERAAVAACVRNAVAHQAWFPHIVCLEMDELHPLDRRLLEEKRLVSPELVRASHSCVAMIAISPKFSILVNEEDHLRIQTMRPGLQVFTAWQHACQIEQNLQTSLDFARSDKQGYVTACSSNKGSGIRVSVMLFLPALIGTNTFSRILQQINAVGYTVRGMYGEGSQSFGSLVQISRHLMANQKTRQKHILQQLHRDCETLIAEERRARRQLLTSFRNFAQKQINQVQRSVSQAERIRFRTGMAMVSRLRLATAIGLEQHRYSDRNRQMHNEKRLAWLDRLMIRIQPAHILNYGFQHRQSSDLDCHNLSDYEDRLRAEVLQQALGVYA